jgi:hypothetical protein
MNLGVVERHAFPTGRIPKSFAVRVYVMEMLHELTAINSPVITDFKTCGLKLPYHFVPKLCKPMAVDPWRFADALGVRDNDRFNGEFNRMSAEEDKVAALIGHLTNSQGQLLQAR